MNTKSEIRKYVKSREASASSPASSALIRGRVESLPEFRRASVILAYMSMPGEPLSHETVDEWSRTKTVAIPLVAGDSLRLCIYDRNRLVRGYMDIIEPSADSVIIDPSEIEFALIPGVAFDRRCMRLGHGKGFYDRLLPKLHCPMAGVGQSFRIVDEIPGDTWDVPMDIVITETEIIRPSGK